MSDGSDRAAYEFAEHFLPKLVGPGVIRKLAVHLQHAAKDWADQHAQEIEARTTRATSPGVEVVHVLHRGEVGCNFTRHPPGDWPEGHKWEGIDKLDAVTCADCREAAARYEWFKS